MPKRDRHGNSGLGSPVAEKVVQAFFQVCADPTFYIPVPLILVVSDKRREFLVPERAFRPACARLTRPWRTIGKIWTRKVGQARLFSEKRS